MNAFEGFNADQYPWLVVATDTFMSGWGGARNGNSYAAWACRDVVEVMQAEDYARSRSDMSRVRFVRAAGYRPGRYCAHLTIYKWADKGRD